MADVEYVDRSRGLGAFPAAWGVPAGTAYSEARALWIFQHAAEEQRRSRWNRGLPGSTALRVVQALADCP